MKLLLDENLSRRLVPPLQDLFPGSSQVVVVGLQRATDRELWDCAKRHDFVIVTHDADFEESSVLLGTPPHVVWLKGANASKSEILHLLNSQAAQIARELGEGRSCIEIAMRSGSD